MASSSRRKTANADYDTLTQAQLVYKRPDINIGSIAQTPRIEWMFCIASRQMYQGNTEMPPGLCHLYHEILDNASDSCTRARAAGIELGRIDVTLDEKEGSVTVRSNGEGILIEESENYRAKTGESRLIPSLIFGELNSSSNYDDAATTRIGIGANGLGAKCTNIFSLLFDVSIGDPHNGLRYHQRWTDNMQHATEPIVCAYPRDFEPFVEITWRADFARMSMTGYPTEARDLFARRLVDVAFAQRVPCSFNGTELSFSDLLSYARLFFAPGEREPFENFVLHYEYEPDTPTLARVIEGQKVIVSRDSSILPKTQVLLLDTPSDGSIVTFVNGNYMRDGGTHVDAVYEAVSNHVIAKLSPESLSQKAQKSLGIRVTAPASASSSGSAPSDAQGGTATGVKRKAARLTVADIKRHTSLFMFVWVENPSWQSQMKGRLSDSKTKMVVRFRDGVLDRLLSWSLTDLLMQELRHQQSMAMVRTDGSKRGHVTVPKYLPANYAGTKDSDRCTLYLTEGDSASTYALYLVNVSPGGRDYGGVFPLRGVPLNVMNCTDEQLLKPQGIVAALKQIIGIREGIDYTHDTSTLRYGRIVIMADADIDAYHIVGLAVLIFHHLYPTMVHMLHFVRTPILKATCGSVVHKFYSEPSFERWNEEQRASPSPRRYKIKYYKGLGTSTQDEAEAEYDDLHLVQFDDDAPKSDSAMRLAFDAGRSDDRKRWIASPNPKIDLERMTVMPISLFINQELIEYSRETLRRMLPSFDGLKRVQRKIVFGCLDKFGRKGTGDAVKCTVLGSHCVLLTAYKNGETSMYAAITHMAQDFVGANNMPLLVCEGNAGTRRMQGSDASNPRYIFFRPESSWQHIFNRHDDALLRHVYEEDQTCEPVVYLPIVPLLLINGCSSIATGWSSFVPSHSPIDVIDWLVTHISSLRSPTSARVPPTRRLLPPHYRGFTGPIYIKLRGSQNRGDDANGGDEPDPQAPCADGLEPDELFGGGEKRMSMVTEGVWSRLPNGDVAIRELPLQRSNDNYEDFLGSLQKNKQIVGWSTHSKTDTVDFVIRGPQFEVTTTSLRLRKTFGLSNIVALDDRGNPQRFDDTSDYLVSWFAWRRPYYSDRKRSIVDILGKSIAETDRRVLFITLIVDDVIKVSKRTRDDVHRQMDEHSIPHDVLNHVSLLNLTAEKLDELRSHRDKQQAELEDVMRSDPLDMWLADLEAFRQWIIDDDRERARKTALKEAKAAKRTASHKRDAKKR